MRWLSISILLAACGGAPVHAEEATASPVIIDVATGQRVSFDAMVTRLVGARVVYVGERHDRAEDHRAQRAILIALHAQGPARALGFEMVQRPFQAALDAYARGEADEAELLSEVEWETRWGFDFAMYRPLLEFGREHRLRLVGLNAPQETTRTIAREGVQALDEATREGLPEMNRDDSAHRARVIDALSHHPGMDDAMLERFYTAQLVWDETMAETVAATEGPMIVFAGGMHVAREAIPMRAARRGAEPYGIVVFEDEMPEEAAADFVWLTGPLPEDH